MLVFVYHNVVQQHIRAWWAFVITLFSGICKWIYAFGLDLLEGSRFPKGKICFEHQFSYVYKEVIKADFWFKGSGYYNEYPWAQSSSKKVFLHTQNHPQTQSSRAAPEMQAKNEEILFVVAKQNIPELWMSPCIIPVLCLLQYCFYLSHRRRLSITVCQLSLSVSFYLDLAANWSCKKKQSKCLFNTKKTVFHIKKNLKIKCTHIGLNKQLFLGLSLLWTHET